MTSPIDGIYSGYMAGAGGTGFSMFVFLNGVVSGADPLGVLFDGSYVEREDSYSVEVEVNVPSGGTVVQGASAGPAGMTYHVNLSLPLDFIERDFTRIDTPLGPVNLRLKRVRDMTIAS